MVIRSNSTTAGRRSAAPPLRRLLPLLLLLAVLSVLSAVSPASAAEAPPAVLKLGAVLPLSGPLAGVGYRAWVVLNQSLADLAAGSSPLPDTRLQLLVADSHSTTAGATRATISLAAQGVVGIIAGVEGGQNQNLTALPRALQKLGLSAAQYAAAIGPQGAAALGVGAGSAHLRAVVAAAAALRPPLPVLGTSHFSCVAPAAANLLPLCASPRSVASAISATISAFGWTQLLVVSMDSAADGDGFNERYDAAGGSFSASTGAAGSVGAHGGGSTLSGSAFDLALAVELEREAYGDDSTSGSPTHLPTWPYRSHPLHAVTRFRLPTLPSQLAAAARSVVAQIKASQRRVVLVLLQGRALTELLQAAYEAEILGPPFVWMSAGQDSLGGGPGSEGILLGQGSAASLGRGGGLCSQSQAGALESFRLQALAARIAAGLAGGGGSTTSGSGMATQSVVDNPITTYSTSNPLGGVLCFAPGLPSPSSSSSGSSSAAAAAAWVNLRYKLSAGGTALPKSTVPDANDGALYDAPLLYAHALRALLDSGANQTASLREPALSRALRQSRGIRGVAGVYSFFSSDTSSPYAAASMPPRDGTRVSRIDLLNFEQLSSSSSGSSTSSAASSVFAGAEGVTFVRRGTFDEQDLSLNFSSAIRWGGGVGSTVVPVDYTPRWLPGQLMAKTHQGLGVGLALALLVVSNFNAATHIFQSKKFDPSDPVKRSKHLYALARAAAPYALLTVAGNIYLGQMMLRLESVHDLGSVAGVAGTSTAGLDPVYSGGVFVGVGLLASWLLVFLGFVVAGSQNGSAVGVYSNHRIARYELAGKSGVAGGGGGSGVNFLSSESGGDGQSGASAGNSVHNVAGGRIKATAYGGSSTAKGNHHSHKRLLHALGGGAHGTAAAAAAARMQQKSVPLWSLALEELYITMVLTLTSWRMLLSGAILSVAWVVVFESMHAGMVLPLSLAAKVNSGGLVGASVLLWFAQSYGMAILFRELRPTKQAWGLAFLTGANVGLWYLWDAARSYTYVLTSVTLLGDSVATPLLVQANPSAKGSDMLSADDISLALFVLVALAILNSLAQVIDILKLSRGTLDQILLAGKEDLARLEADLLHAREATRAQGRYGEHLRRILELINLARPLHRNHALAFALADPQSAAVGATGARGKGVIVPPCFDQHERGGGAGGGVSTGIVASVGVGGSGGSPPLGSHALTVLHKRDASGPKSSPTHAHAHQPTMVLPGSRGPSEGIKVPTAADHAHAHAHAAHHPHHSLTESPGVAGAAASTGNPYEGLDFSFLARAKSEAAGLKLLQEFSDALFIASGPVHHRAVADIGLLHVLNHPVTVELFKDTLVRPQSLWSLTLWMDAQRFKVLGAPEARRAVADGMWHTFLAAGAPHYITAVQASTREMLGKAINAAVAGGASVRHLLFEPLESELLYQLQKEMTNFTGTAAFKISALVLGHSAYQPTARVGTLVVRRAAQHNSTGDGHTTQGGTGGAGGIVSRPTGGGGGGGGSVFPPSPLGLAEGSSLNGAGGGRVEQSEVGSEVMLVRAPAKAAGAGGAAAAAAAGSSDATPNASPPVILHTYAESSPSGSPVAGAVGARGSAPLLASPSGTGPGTRAHGQQRSDDVQMVALSSPSGGGGSDSPMTPVASP